ncbi:Response regulator receiver domain-containing protein [Spirosomataceae bacterium TFI 002]|nr:Response regulator receiver domain-containing protein [Spirosomataceae bacterium TFI 002]
MKEINILLAEDNNILRKSLCFFLEKNGFLVDQFSNGQEALNSVINKRYDMVLLDINMPGKSGMEITQHIRTKLLLQVPIIILTSSNVEQTEVDSFTIGADEFIAKPISPIVLMARISKLLKK